MKKIFRSLITIALSAPLLSGCSLFGDDSDSFPSETKEISKLDLRDYTKTILKGSNYKYDGKVYVVYADKTDKEVTSYCTFDSIDTSSVGAKTFKAKYETTDKIYSAIGSVNVVDSISLTSIDATNYTSKVKLNATYTFDGKVTAYYSDGTEKDVSSLASISSIDTSSSGIKELNIFYTEGGVTKFITKQIEVLTELTDLVLSGYVNTYVQGQTVDQSIKVEARYSDGSKKDVTSSATVDFSEIDTSSVGTYLIKASYTEDGKTVSGSAQVNVTKMIPTLVSIEVSGEYNSTVEKGETYTFNGVVLATFSEGDPIDVTSSCTFSKVYTTSVGDKTLTISYKDPNSNVTKSVSVTVTVISRVTGIDVESSLKIALDDVVSLNASVIPSDATNKKLTYSSSNADVVSVDLEGNVTGKAATVEPVIITITSVDKPEISKEVSVTVIDEPKLISIEASGYTSSIDVGETYSFDGKVFATYSKGDPVDITDDCSFSSISTSSGGKKSMTITYLDPVWGIKKTCKIEITVIAHVTSINVNTSFKVGLNSTSNLNASALPNDATDKSLTYESANTSIASVDSNGNVTGNAVGDTTITITSVDRPAVSAVVNVSVTDENDAWTILLYMCGADLESGGDYGISYGGAATSDLEEILSVSGQPDDVNFVIQTGGAKAWKSTYGISSSYNQRYHVENKQLVKDNNKVYNSYKGMGESATLKDFLVWGLETYPAEKVGLILWNHGGGLVGVCCDEKDSDDSLTNNEVVTAVSGALTQVGLSKLEFIGYDACLMQMMEIAEFNAPYFNYQVAAQESENGTGWDYDTWVDDLYAKKDSEVIFKAIVDGFIADNGGVNGKGDYYDDGYGGSKYYPADQTLSYLDLGQIADFKSAWEAMATQVKLKITSSNKSTFKNNVVGASKYFAGDDYEYYAEFDCYDFLDKLSSNSTFNPGGNYISNVRTALNSLIKYNVVQKEGASDAHGLSFYFGKTYNSSTYSHFTNWVSLVSTVGGFEYNGGWWY